MNKKREILEKLLEAFCKKYECPYTTEQIDVFERYCTGIEGDMQEPEGFREWLNFKGTLEEIEDDRKIRELIERPGITSDIFAEIVSKEGIGLSFKNLKKVFNFIERDFPSSKINDNIISELASQNLESERKTLEGIANAYRGVGVKELPSIILSDHRVLRFYFMAIAREKHVYHKGESYNYIRGQKVLKGKNFDPKDENYRKIIEREQSELGLRHEKEEQDELRDRTQKIAQAEALVDKKQGQQQE